MVFSSLSTNTFWSSRSAPSAPLTVTMWVPGSTRRTLGWPSYRLASPTRTPSRKRIAPGGAPSMARLGRVSGVWTTVDGIAHAAAERSRKRTSSLRIRCPLPGGFRDIHLRGEGGGKRTADHLAHRPLVGLRLAEQAHHPERGHLPRLERHVEPRLLALHGVARLHHVQNVSLLDPLALPARYEDLSPPDVQDVRLPLPVPEPGHQAVDDVGDGRGDGAVVQRGVVVRPAAEPRDLAGLRARLPRPDGGEVRVAGLHVDQPDVHLRLRGLHLGAAEEPDLAAHRPAELGDRADDQRVGADELRVAGDLLLPQDLVQVGALEDHELSGLDQPGG